MKRFFLGIIAFALIIYATIFNMPTILIIGILTLISILFLKPKALLQIITTIISKTLALDILEDVKQNFVSEMKQKYTKIRDTEINKINTANTSNAISTAISDIIKDHIICSNCGSENVVQIPWESDFDKFLEKKDFASNPAAYHCNDCGVKYIRYAF